MNECSTIDTNPGCKKISPVIAIGYETQSLQTESRGISGVLFLSLLILINSEKNEIRRAKVTMQNNDRVISQLTNIYGVPSTG